MINTELIRNKILDLAIQGKLFQGDKSTMAPIIPEVDDQIEVDLPFSIPTNWRWAKIGWVMTIERGGSPRPIKAFLTSNEDGINWIKIGDVAKNGKYIEQTKEKIKPEGEAKSRRVHPGDFLLTNSMSFGRPYISKIEGCVHDGWLILRNDHDLFYYDYLYYLLSSPYAYDQFSKKATGSTVDNLNIDKVADAIVPIPPISDQELIVERIEEVLREVGVIEENQKRYINDYDVLKDKIIDAGIQGQLTTQLPEDGMAEHLLEVIKKQRSEDIKKGKIKKDSPISSISEEEKPFTIPDNWAWVRLGSIATVLGGKRIPAGRKLTTDDTGHKYIRVSEMKDRTVNTEGLLYVPEDIYPSISRYIINKEDVYITVAGTIGRVGKIPEELDGANLTENADRLVFSNLDQDWLIYCLSSTIVQKQIEMLTTQVAQPKLAIKRIQEFLIPLPPLEEQKRISIRIGEVLASLS